MDLKERLNRLTSVSQTPPAEKSPVLRELRERLERLLEPKKVYRKRQITPVEQLVRGETIPTPYGEAFLVKDYFPPDFRYGEMTLYEILDIPTYPAHLLTKDERLKGLDFQKALFLDTETTGLSGGTGTFAFMVGLGFFEKGGFSTHQYFMRDYSEEKACLSLVQEFLESFEFLVTFNGRYYDVPLLETRFILSRIPSRIREMPNFDLLYPSRKIWKGAYDNCRLVTLESQLLGMERGDDVPSEWIPQLYFEYVQTGDAQRIYPIFYHNRMDILTMVALAGRIHLVYHDPQVARPRKGVEHLALGRLFWEHHCPEKAIQCFEIALKRCDESLTWSVMRWLSMAFKKTGQMERALAVWEEMLTWPYQEDISPYLELAKYHEHRRKDFEKAIDYVEKALRQIPSHQQREIEMLLYRKRRLEQKRRENPDR